MYLLLNKNFDLVTIQSKAGYGKTYLALACALSLVLKNKIYKKIVVTKSTYELGKSIGFLPGNLNEKFAPAIKPIIDLIFKLHKNRSVNKLFKNSDNIGQTPQF